MASYKVLSQHYEGPASVSWRPKIKAEDIRSSTSNIKMSPGSYPYGNYSMTFKDGLAYFKTANKTEAFSLADIGRWGANPTSWDESADRMEGWYRAGNRNNSSWHDHIPRMPDISYVTGVTPLGMHFPSKRDTKVNLSTTPPIVEAVNPNRIGYHEGKKGSLYHELRSNVLFDNFNNYRYDAPEWLNFLAEKGYSVEKSGSKGIIGLGVEHDIKGSNYFAGYYQSKGYLVVPADFYARAKRLADRYGLSDAEGREAVRRMILLHEIGHVAGIEGGRKDEEMLGYLQAEFHYRTAERFKGTKWERIHKALAQENIDYARSHSLSNSVRRLSFNISSDKISGLELLAAKFEAEGRAFGMEGKELDDYINSRMRDTYGAMLKEKPSHRGKNLEKIIEDEDGTKHYVMKDGTRLTAYEGKEGYKEKDYDEKEDKSTKYSKSDREAKDSRAEKVEAREAAEQAA